MVTRTRRTSSTSGTLKRAAPARLRTRKTRGTEAPEREAPRSAGPRPFWSGTISFGLVSVPVSLHSAVRSQGVALRMLAEDGTPLQRRYFCPADERDVPYEDVVRGYEVAPDEHVIVTDEELEALAPRASRDIDLRRFVPLEELDPLFFESSYVLAPSGDSVKAYRLLARIMEDEQRAGIATFVLRDKEYLIAIIAREGVLHAETLRFADEVRTPADAGLPEPAKVPRDLAQKFARALKEVPAKLDRETLEDSRSAHLRELVEEKLRRRTDVIEAPEAATEADEERPEGDPADLMSVLKRSLAGMRASDGRPARGRRAASAKKTRSTRRRVRA